MLLPAVVHAQFEYTTNNGTITITKYNGPGGSVTIPDTIKGLQVTSIGFYAFEGCGSLTNVNISDNVSSIGNAAFADCWGLSGVTIPHSVTNIDNDAFYACHNLTNVNMPNRVTHIGHTAFYGCRLTNVMVPSSVDRIGTMAFAGCTNLPAIMVDSNNPAYSSLGGVLFDKSQSMLVEYPSGLAGNYVIPNSVTLIGVESFCDCALLTGVTIPDSVTRIEFGTFSACSSLNAITVATNNLVYSSMAGVLFDKSQTVLIRCSENINGNYTIPNSVTNIGFHTFTSCFNLTNVTLSDQVTSIGSDAFRWCPNLTCITIPASVTNIDDWAFADCTTKDNRISHTTNFTNLAKVYFQGNAPTIGQNAFNRDDEATVYYLPGKTGWGATFCGRPTALWKQ
jgi:hypothetical protein